jgi:hypothetical protein
MSYTHTRVQLHVGTCFSCSHLHTKVGFTLVVVLEHDASLEAIFQRLGLLISEVPEVEESVYSLRSED